MGGPDPSFYYPTQGFGPDGQLPWNPQGPDGRLVDAGRDTGETIGQLVGQEFPSPGGGWVRGPEGTGTVIPFDVANAGRPTAAQIAAAQQVNTLRSSHSTRPVQAEINLILLLS